MFEHYSEVSPFRAGLLCRCPRCGEGKLYDGILNVAERCAVCELDLTAQDSGDGPAVFAIFLIGILAVGLAALVELNFAPPTWVHLLYQVPFVLGGSLLLLRPLKALLIALQYRHKAAGF